MLLTIIALCLGLMISVPRTAATTYELSVLPLTDKIGLPFFCIAFFALVLVLSIAESAVVDIVGKVLAPLLFIGLLFLILKGIITPVGSIASPMAPASVISSGIASGYQTMDVFASIFLGALVLNSASNKGYTSISDQTKVSVVAGLIASAGLLMVYLGLTYLGATASTTLSADANHTSLLISIIQVLLPGSAGTLFFGVVTGLACLTTAIALTSSTAGFFSTLLQGRIGYRTILAVICVCSAALACIGIDQLIAFASEILAVVYPPVLVLTFLTFLDRWLNQWAYRLGAFAALAVCLLEKFGLGSLVGPLPFAALGFAWVFPAAAGCLIGQLCFRCPAARAKKSTDAPSI